MPLKAPYMDAKMKNGRLNILISETHKQMNVLILFCCVKCMCRVNCSQEVLSVDATIVDRDDKISEISLTRDDLIKDKIRDTTKDVNGILTMSSSSDYFKVLDYLQDRTKGDIPISILNIILSEVNSGRTESM